MLRLSRKVWTQLAILATVTVVATAVMAFGFVKVPALLGIGRYTVTVDLPAGGVTAVFGRSGSGKTTLLRCIAGLEQTLDGSLIVNGETWQDGSYRRPVHQRALGYVFQEARLFPHLSVAANLDFGRRRIAESERRVSLAQVVELLGIAHLVRIDEAATGQGDPRQMVQRGRYDVARQGRCDGERCCWHGYSDGQGDRDQARRDPR